MDIIVKEWLTHYGPLGIGWVMFAVLLWYVVTERRKPNGTLKAYQDIVEDYHEAIVANTRATERLATLIEERTRPRR